MSMISVHLTRKPSTTRFLVAQRVEGNGVLQNEVPKQERPCLQCQRVDSHRTILANGSVLCPFRTVPNSRPGGRQTHPAARASRSFQTCFRRRWQRRELPSRDRGHA